MGGIIHHWLQVVVDTKVRRIALERLEQLLIVPLDGLKASEEGMVVTSVNGDLVKSV